MANFYDVNAAIDKPNYFAAAVAGYEAGHKRREDQRIAEERNQLRTLAPAAIAGDPSAQSQAMALDPTVGQQYTSAADGNMRRLKGGMDYLKGAMDSGNPQRIAAAEAQVGPYLASITGKPWTPGALTQDPSAFEAAYARIAMSGAGPEAREGKVVGNNLVDPVTGDVIYQGPEVPVNAQIVQVPDGKGGFLSMMFDPRTRQLADLPVPNGGPAAAPVGNPAPAAPQAGPQSYAEGDASQPPSSDGFDFQDLVGNGVTMTNWRRTPEHNARVGGVENSAHLTGDGADFIVPQALKAGFMARVQQRPGWRAIDEGDHIHVQRPRSGGAEPQTGRVGYTPPKPKAAPAGYDWQGDRLVAIPGGPADKPSTEDKAPAGYRFAADGSTLEAIPGGPADKPKGQGVGGKPLPADARMKLGMLRAARAALDNYEQAVLPDGGGFNELQLFSGPAGGYLDEAVNNVLRVESGAAVPQDETERGIARYGARIWNTEPTARANAAQLRQKIDILERELTGQDPSAPAPSSSSPDTSQQKPAIRILSVRAAQ